MENVFEQLDIEFKKLVDRGATGISIFIPESSDKEKIAKDILKHLSLMNKACTKSISEYTNKELDRMDGIT